MQLQKFVTASFEAMGGIVEPVEYALCYVLIPDEYIERFQGRSEVMLAFDFEVAQENPECEFVTFGSYILNQIFDIISESTISSVRYAVVDRLTLPRAEDKIKGFFDIQRGNVKIEKERFVMGMFVVFTFRTGYVSDERVESIEEVWIDLLTLKLSYNMYSRKAGLFYEKEPLYDYPVPVLPNTQNAFEKAYLEIKKRVESNISNYTRKAELDKEIRRIDSYYSELMEENEKRKGRKGITEEKIQELTSKGKSLELERDRQLREMHDKYTVKADIALEHGILYAVPHIEYKVKIIKPGTANETTVYYNPIIKDFCEKL